MRILSMGKRARRALCERRGHDWFPDNEPREFIPSATLCLRCGEHKVMLPWGTCLREHPLREHYDEAGKLVLHAYCPEPQ